MAGRQQDIPGSTPKKNQKIEDAAIAFVEKRDERMALQVEEKKLKGHLDMLMLEDKDKLECDEKGNPTYHYHDGKPRQVVYDESINVKVKTLPADE